MKKAVLFDIDGTILDAWDFVIGAFKYTVEFHGLKKPAEKVLKSARGKPLLDFYQTAFPNLDPKILAKTHDDFQKDKFDRHKLFPKAKNLLKKLKKRGFLLAAVSNRTRVSLQLSLKIVGIDKYFDLVLSAEDVANPKPHKDHLLLALKHFQVSPKNAFMVGDTDHDIMAGKNAGVRTVGVTFGFWGKSIKETKPDYIIDDLTELEEILI